MNIGQTQIDILKQAYHFILERKGSQYFVKALDAKNRVWYSHAFDRVIDAMMALEELKDKSQLYPRNACSA